jgi:hypothetical protein
MVMMLNHAILCASRSPGQQESEFFTMLAVLYTFISVGTDDNAGLLGGYFVPGHSLGDLPQDLPCHDPRTNEGRFAVTDFRISHDVTAQHDSLFSAHHGMSPPRVE